MQLYEIGAGITALLLFGVTPQFCGTFFGLRLPAGTACAQEKP
ncbi:hypothetical protein [Halopseudomonas xiamenensis]|nr:hypothetical protein [Halopseudomonas xiamenensis]